MLFYQDVNITSSCNVTLGNFVDPLVPIEYYRLDGPVYFSLQRVANRCTRYLLNYTITKGPPFLSFDKSTNSFVVLASQKDFEGTWLASIQVNISSIYQGFNVS